MTIAGEGANPRMEHFLEVARKMNIDTIVGKRIVREIKQVVANWKHYADLAGVEQREFSRLQKLFLGLGH